MDFITVEQFKDQTLEVQKVFIDWWNCEPHDIYAWVLNSKGNKWCIESCNNQIQADTINKGKAVDFCIPLFTEGQIRRFIEDKTGYDLEIIKTSSVGKCADICFYNRVENGNHPKFRVGTQNLFQAYWQVACEIAKELL